MCINSIPSIISSNGIDIIIDGGVVINLKRIILYGNRACIVAVGCILCADTFIVIISICVHMIVLMDQMHILNCYVML